MFFWSTIQWVGSQYKYKISTVLRLFSSRSSRSSIECDTLKMPKVRNITAPQECFSCNDCVLICFQRSYCIIITRIPLECYRVFAMTSRGCRPRQPNYADICLAQKKSAKIPYRKRVWNRRQFKLTNHIDFVKSCQFYFWNLNRRFVIELYWFYSFAMRINAQTPKRQKTIFLCLVCVLWSKAGGMKIQILVQLQIEFYAFILVTLPN